MSSSARLFRVRGEVGCFSISVYENSSPSMFYPLQRNRQYYRTSGYRETVFYDGVVNQSYRKVCERYNRLVRQSPSEGLRPSSLQYEVQAEALRLESSYLGESAEILTTSGFDSTGLPSRELDTALSFSTEVNTSAVTLETAFEEVCQEAPEWLQADLKLVASDYENPDTSVLIEIDDVCNKKQRATRSKKEDEAEPISGTQNDIQTRSDGKKNYKKRKFLYHSVATVITKKGTYSLTAAKLAQLWPLLIALLLANTLLKKKWVFILDGHTILYDFLIDRLQWRPYTMILDWYHLRKKIHTQAFKALKKNEQRDKWMLKLEQFAWYGLTKQAQQFIDQTPQGIIKNPDELERLQKYFERNQDRIHNYAMRKKLGLVCSSNRVEKQNDLIVAARQKRNGMSWTRKGSDALATLSVLKQNGLIDTWIHKNEISWNMAA